MIRNEYHQIKQVVDKVHALRSATNEVLKGAQAGDIGGDDAIKVATKNAVAEGDLYAFLQQTFEKLKFDYDTGFIPLTRYNGYLEMYKDLLTKKGKISNTKLNVPAIIEEISNHISVN